MTTLTEGFHPGSCLISEEENNHCRDAVIVALSQTVTPNMVLGKRAIVASVTSSAAADAGNTGNGTFTLDVTNPVGAGARNGVYRAVCIAVAANGGEFEVLDPKGVEIGRVAVGATFNNQVKFVIADGSTDFAAGDAFSIAVGVEPGDEEFGALNLSATDGLQNAAAIAIYGATTDGSNKGKIAALTRGPAQVRGADLTWPGGITAVQQAAATAQLAQLGIIIR